MATAIQTRKTLSKMGLVPTKVPTGSLRWYFASAYFSAFFLFAVLSNLHERKEFAQSAALESQPIEDQTSARRPSIARTDVNFALDTIGTGKFASFLNSFHDILD